MKKKQLLIGLIVLAVFAALLVWGRDRIHFDFGAFRTQLALANWSKIALGLGCIYAAYIFRSVRWALLLRHNRKVHPLSLLGTQVIGFTAVALIGRVADPVRPWLVAKKTGLPVSQQVAVYIVERLFDFGSMALIFSLAVLPLPSEQIMRATGHSGFIARLAISHPDFAVLFARYGGLAVTICAAIFLVVIRFAGELVAGFLERSLGIFSKNLGASVANKIRTFHSGLDTMRSFGDFAITLSLSLAMWVVIAAAYFYTCQAFSASPQLASIDVSRCALLMIASGGASALQLPIIGWFSQIGLVAVALSAVLGSSAEASTACAATLLLVTFLGIIPIGLVWSQFEHLNLRKLTSESGHVREEQESVEA